MDEKTTIKQRKEWYNKEVIEDESWKYVIGSNKEYMISNYGRIKRIEQNREMYIMPYIRAKQSPYMCARLTYNHIHKQYKVSTLVGIHFHGLPQNGEVLRHKNGIKTEHYSHNLEYVQRSDIAKKAGALATSRPVVQIDIDTNEVINEYRSAAEAGRACFLTRQAILNCCKGRNKTSGGFIFKFAEEIERTSSVS